MSETLSIEGVRLTHPDKVLYPDQGLSKRALAEYFVKAAKRMLSFVADHPLTLVRCPQGISGQCFYQRHLAEGMPEGFQGAKIAESDGEKAEYLYIKDVAGLIGAAQIGVLEIHVWGAPVANVEKPDRLVLDLDPSEEVGFSEVKKAAKDIRDVLKAVGLASYPLITGGRGIHVVTPLAGENGWDEVKSFGGARSRTGGTPSLHRAIPQGQAEGANFHRLATQRALSDGGCALFAACPQGSAGRHAAFVERVGQG
jgi:bifunctional non-homologous end joining protein LigD